MKDNLEVFFSPKNVVVIGVSQKPGKIGYEVFRSIIESQYDGQVFAINPRCPEILGLQTYPSLQAIPVLDIDLIVYAIDLVFVPKTLEEAAEKNTKAMIIVSGGGREQQTEDRINLEERIRVLARKFNIRIIGPNCIGIFSIESGLDTFFQSRERMLRPSPQEKTMSFLTQSGTVGCAFLEYAAESQIGVSRFVSYGNRVDVSEFELIRTFKGDKVIGLYIEGLEKGRELIKAIEEVNTPVVVLKSGRSSQGSQASISHTGWLGGSWKVFEGALNQAGAIITNSYRQFFSAIRTLTLLNCYAKGKRIALLSNGAGPMVSAIDLAVEKKLEITELLEKTIEKLSNGLPSFYLTRNPIDLTGSATAKDYQFVIEVLSNENVDLIMPWFVMQDTPLNLESLSLQKTLRKVNQKKPIICGALGGPFTRKMSNKLTETTGVPVFETPEEWITAAWAVVKGSEIIQRSKIL